MTHLGRFSTVALAAVLLVVPAAAKAQSPGPPTLDQSQNLFVTPLGVGGPAAMLAQSFTAASAAASRGSTSP
jgi:hypothetical protein